MSFQEDRFDESPRQYDRVRYQAVELFLRPSEDASPEIVKRSKRQTTLRYFLDEISKAGMQYALANGTDLNSFEDDLLWPGLSVVTDLHSCLVEDMWKRDDPTETYNFWHHERPPLDVNAFGNPPYFDRTGIENVTTAYLDLPYRAPEIERLLVDVLIAMELYAYGAEMIAPRNLPRMKWFPSRCSAILYRMTRSGNLPIATVPRAAECAGDLFRETRHDLASCNREAWPGCKSPAVTA